MTTWFLSDLHLGHKRVSEDRGFDSIGEHDAVVLKSIRDRCKGKGDLWLLGDIFWGAPDMDLYRSYLASVPSATRLIRGNHDDYISKREKSPPFLEVQDMKFLRLGERKLHLCHYPLESWRSSSYGSWHLHGHSHGRGRKRLNRLDVSWECFKGPIALEELGGVIDSNNQKYLEELNENI